MLDSLVRGMAVPFSESEFAISAYVELQATAFRGNAVILANFVSVADSFTYDR